MTQDEEREVMRQMYEKELTSLVKRALADHFLITVTHEVRPLRGSGFFLDVRNMRGYYPKEEKK